MNETIRIILVIATCSIYTALIITKIADIHRTGPPDSCREKPGRSLRTELARLILDCAAMLGFMLSGLYPAWFRLFPDTPLGFVTGFVLLVSMTLIFSIFVDGIAMRRQIRQKGGYGRFWLRQLISLVQIEAVFILIWLCFLVLEPTGANFFVRIAVTVGIGILVLIILRTVRRAKMRRDTGDSTHPARDSRETDNDRRQSNPEEEERE